MWQTNVQEWTSDYGGGEVGFHQAKKPVKEKIK
jgi:hypothetical protein